MSFSTKYRPTTLDEVVGQDGVVKILRAQLEKGTFKHSYIFEGNTGCGKTTVARILANEVNRGKGNPIEIDAASNNGVDNVRAIVESAQERSIVGDYKVFIIDECHSITSQGWQAFLKSIEEPSPYTIFIFCTTEVNKVPQTILNRCQRLHFGRIEDELVKERLERIAYNELLIVDKGVIDFIVKSANGSMRQAITNLDKVADYDTHCTMDNALMALNKYSSDVFFDLVNAIIDKKMDEVVNIIENEVGDARVPTFVDDLVDFALDMSKYCLFKDTKNISPQNAFIDKLNYTTGNGEQLGYFVHLQDEFLSIKESIKHDSTPKLTLEVRLMGLAR